MRKSEYFLIIDTETCNTMEQPLVYDIGYAIANRKGEIVLERSFVVADTFFDMKDVMSSAYYAKKIPSYWEDIKNGVREVRTLKTIKAIVRQDIADYNIKTVGAYNMAFDKRALNTSERYFTQSFFRWFFPFGMEYICIWNMACQVLMDSRNYIKFCIDNDLLTDKGNIQTSAETCYKYITKRLDFEEVHKGLDDVRIEVEIMAKCFARHKKMDKGINTQCWRIPQRKRKVLENK